MRVWTRIYQQHTNEIEIDEEFESLLTQLCEEDEITVEFFVSFDDNLTTSTFQKSADLIDCRQQAREEAIKEVVTDTFSVSQAVNVASDDDEDDQEEKPPWQLTASEALQHFSDLLHFFMIKNDALSAVIDNVTDKIQNKKLSTLKQSNSKRFFCNLE